MVASVVEELGLSYSAMVVKAYVVPGSNLELLSQIFVELQASLPIETSCLRMPQEHSACLPPAQLHVGHWSYSSASLLSLLELAPWPRGFLHGATGGAAMPEMCVDPSLRPTPSARVSPPAYRLMQQLRAMEPAMCSKDVEGKLGEWLEAMVIAVRHSWMHHDGPVNGPQRHQEGTRIRADRTTRSAAVEQPALSLTGVDPWGTRRPRRTIDRVARRTWSVEA